MCKKLHQVAVFAVVVLMAPPLVAVTGAELDLSQQDDEKRCCGNLGQGGSLSAAELDRLQKEVLQRCGLRLGTSAKALPWYYYFELAGELERRGDQERALESLVEATLRRPESTGRAWMYGMWFVDYLPYHRIARLHLDLGNLECASEALQLAERYDETVVARGEIDLDALREEIRAQRGSELKK